MSIPSIIASYFSVIFPRCLTSVLHSLQTKTKAFPPAWHPRLRDKESQVCSVVKELADVQLEYKTQLLYSTTPCWGGKSIRACKERKTASCKILIANHPGCILLQGWSNFTCPQQKKQMVREGWTDEWVNLKELSNSLKGMFVFYASHTATTDNNIFTIQCDTIALGSCSEDENIHSHLPSVIDKPVFNGTCLLLTSPV